MSKVFLKLTAFTFLIISMFLLLSFIISIPDKYQLVKINSIVKDIIQKRRNINVKKQFKKIIVRKYKHNKPARIQPIDMIAHSRNQVWSDFI